jgi:hypothetical protein
MRISYLLKRSYDLGFAGIAHSLKCRYKKFFFASHIKFSKNNALKNWRFYAKKYGITLSFKNFFELIKKNNLLSNVFHDPQFQQNLPKLYKNNTKLFFQANKILEGNLSILGAKSSFKDSNWTWHQDIKSKENFFEQYKNIFYQKIFLPKINHNFSSYHPDIKVPWELSRMQHSPILGLANNIHKNSEYSSFFEKNITSWINENNYCYGVNWLCPMDVAIRAINIIWGMDFFKNEDKLLPDFWKKVVISLFQHEEYLKFNWEESDCPNNHYLADLLGYFYVCSYFKFIPYFEKKLHWVLKKLKTQFSWQIQADGSSYEGSTSYHILVTEMLLHLHVMIRQQKLDHIFFTKNLIKKMLKFHSDCTPENNIQIGDNDSGKIVFGLSHPNKNINKKLSVETYKNFGITIIKNQNIHLSFKHPVYSKKQPSGHFHEDQLSITLHIKNVPIFIDPGTYLYTGNTAWRNYFRSRQQHSTVGIKFSNDFLKKQDLFQLKLPNKDFSGSINNNKNYVEIKDTDFYYENLGIVITRHIIYCKQTHVITIKDCIKKIANLTKNFPENLYSFFNVHPSIFVKKITPCKFHIFSQKQKMCTLKSTTAYHLIDSFYSSEYGIKQKTTKLVSNISMKKKEHSLEMTVTPSLVSPTQSQ